MAFHGREDDLAALLAAVSENRLVTITGPIGVGKSRLVTEARSSLEGSLFAAVETFSLDAVPAGSDAATLAGHLGRASSEDLALQLAAADELLILDGCDHVVAGTTELVRALLAAHDGISIVVTSREPLHLDDEFVLVLMPFRVPDIDDPDLAEAPPVAMFVERSRSAGASWPLDASSLAEVAYLCCDLDGLPLAIELAAARARVLSPGELRGALKRKLDLFDSRPGTSERSGSVRAALEVSVDQLADDELRLLQRLSVVPGSFDVGTAHAVAGPTGEVMDTINALDALLARSLLMVDHTRTTTSYRMLGVVRELAREGLDGSGDLIAAGDRFAEVIADLADRMVADSMDRWSGEVLTLIATRIRQLIAAVDWCVEHDEAPDRALRIYLPLFGGVHQRRSAEVKRCGERLFARWPEEVAPLRAECLAVVATGCALASETARARELAGRALIDPAVTAIGIVAANRALVLADLIDGRLTEALDHVRAGEDAATAAAMVPFARELRTLHASIVEQLGDPATGLRMAIDAARDAEAGDDPGSEVWALTVAANIAARSGDWDEVRAQVAGARLAAAAAATSAATVTRVASMFRSETLLVAYDAMAIAHLDGWAASVPYWQSALRGAAAEEGASEVALTIRAAAAVARAMGQASVAERLGDALPATHEISILPDVFAENPRPRHHGPMPVSLEAALDALNSDDAFAQLRDATAPAVDQAGLMRRDGDTWEIAYQGVTARIRHLKGIADLAVLLGKPNAEVHALELMGVVQIGESTGPAIDDQARNSYRTQILDLQEEIDDARAGSDIARAERAEDELDALVAQLSSTLGLGGRSRETGSTAERARSAVTFRIRAAIKRIGEHHEALGKHLRNSVRTGTWCSYAPEQPVAWEVDPA